MERWRIIAGMRYLVTGCAGFIGSSTTDALLADGHAVIGVDCFTDYYDVTMKRANIAAAQTSDRFTLLEIDLARDVLPTEALGVDGIFHFAAQAGVRASWGSEFSTYTDCNVLATQRLLEQLIHARGAAVPLVYASSSSVYGDAMSLPTREDAIPAPVSPYGVTKLAAEHLCHTYAHNHGLNATALRYFTVYGPRQRPDMAFHRFIRAALESTPIHVFGDGEQSRDFTYIDDVVAANIAAMNASHGWAICNIGGGHRATVNEVLAIIEDVSGSTLDVHYSGVQAGDVRHTDADTTRARERFEFAPNTPLAQGISQEYSWLRSLIAT